MFLNYLNAFNAIDDGMNDAIGMLSMGLCWFDFR